MTRLHEADESIQALSHRDLPRHPATYTRTEPVARARTMTAWSPTLLPRRVLHEHVTHTPLGFPNGQCYPRKIRYTGHPEHLQHTVQARLPSLIEPLDAPDGNLPAGKAGPLDAPGAIAGLRGQSRLGLRGQSRFEGVRVVCGMQRL